MPSKKTQVAMAPKEVFNAKIYNPIDPNFVRQGVEDILRISHIIRLQQDTIITALNYSGPPIFPTAPTPQGIVAEAPVAFPPVLYQPGVTSSSNPPPAAPQVKSESNDQGSNDDAKAPTMGRPVSPRLKPSTRSSLGPDLLHKGDQTHTSCSKCPPFSSTLSSNYALPPYSSAAQIPANARAPNIGPSSAPASAPNAAPVPKLPAKRPFSQIGDEFLRLLSEVANRKLKRNAPMPLNVTSSSQYRPTMPPPFFPPTKRTFPGPSGYTGLYPSEAMPYRPVNAPVKLPPLGSDAGKNGVKASGPAYSTLHVPVASNSIEHAGSSKVKLVYNEGQSGSAIANSKKLGVGVPLLGPFVPVPMTASHHDQRPAGQKTSGEKDNVSDCLPVGLSYSMGNKDTLPLSGSSADDNEVFFDALSSTTAPRAEGFPGDGKNPAYQFTLKFMKNKPIPLGLLTGLSISPDAPGVVKSVAANNIPLNKSVIEPIDTVVKPGKKQPVLDVFIDDAIKVAPMISQPPSAQLCYVTETPESPNPHTYGMCPKSAPHAQRASQIQPVLKPPPPPPSKPSDVLHGSLYFKDTDAFNFLIYKESAKDSKKNFMRICEMAWDAYHTKSKPQAPPKK